MKETLDRLRDHCAALLASQLCPGRIAVEVVRIEGGMGIAVAIDDKPAGDNVVQLLAAALPGAAFVDPPEDVEAGARLDRARKLLVSKADALASVGLHTAAARLHRAAERLSTFDGTALLELLAGAGFDGGEAAGWLRLVRCPDLAERRRELAAMLRAVGVTPPVALETSTTKKALVRAGSRLAYRRAQRERLDGAVYQHDVERALTALRALAARLGCRGPVERAITSGAAAGARSPGAA
jgi:hypothetical protein